MACGPCQARRDAAAKALQNRNFREAGAHVAQGVKEMMGAPKMGGILPPGAMPKSRK